MAALNFKPEWSLHRERYSERSLNLAPVWAPPLPPWKPIKKLNSDLRIAVVVSDGLFDSLRFEGNLMLITPDNWQRVLQHGYPDLLLVESTWDTVTGHWYLAQN